MDWKIEFKLNYLSIGVYWETWPDPYRTDIWITVPFIALHIWYN